MTNTLIAESGPSTKSVPADDPVIAQVVRSRLQAITEQMRLALQSVSGSPTVTEASDFFTGLYLPDGSSCTMGHQVTFEAPVVGAVIRHLIDKGVKLNNGDRIIANDPWIGSLHQNDLQMCAPLIVDGELVAWAGVMAHETDMGGMDFASWSPKAKEVYQEGMRIPAVKLVDAGELREDVMDMILMATRLPAQVGLDIRAFIATLNVASERLTEICRRYSTPVVKAAMASLVDDSERRMRERLRTLPDARVHVSDFLEHDGHENRLYKVDLVLTKQGDQITMDFSGSSAQAPGFINCTRAGLYGGVAGSMIPTLGWGITWNDGHMRVVDIVAPDGLVVTALAPAPVGSATVEAVWTVSNVVAAALNRLLAASHDFAPRAQAISSGTMATFNMSGRDREGHLFGLHLMDPLAGGFGAFGSHDGQDAAGPINAPCPSIADVEVNEQKMPLYYLHRRLAPDTGGAGRRRGGLSGEIAITITVPKAEALVMTHGAEVPNSTGLSGGLPGSCVVQALARNALPEARSEIDPQEFLTPRLYETEAFELLGPKPGAFGITDRDVFAVTWQGGGGIGDPLDRLPQDVLIDIRRGAVTAEHARAFYGVEVERNASGKATSVDKAVTIALRRSIRAARLGVSVGDVPEVTNDVASAAAPPGLVDGEKWLPLGDRLRAIQGQSGSWRTETIDGAVLSVGSTRWREGARRIPFKLPASVGSSLHAELTVTGWACPKTGHLIGVDIHRQDEEPVHDFELANGSGLNTSLARAG